MSLDILVLKIEASKVGVNYDILYQNLALEFSFSPQICHEIGNVFTRNLTQCQSEILRALGYEVQTIQDKNMLMLCSAYCCYYSQKIETKIKRTLMFNPFSHL